MACTNPRYQNHNEVFHTYWFTPGNDGVLCGHHMGFALRVFQVEVLSLGCAVSKTAKVIHTCPFPHMVSKLDLIYASRDRSNGCQKYPSTAELVHGSSSLPLALQIQTSV